MLLLLKRNLNQNKNILSIFLYLLIFLYIIIKTIKMTDEITIEQFRNSLDSIDLSDSIEREKSLEICFKFRTVEYFSWDIFIQLVRPEIDSKKRMFVYSSLSFLIKDYWESIPEFTQFAILSSYPFLFGADPKNETLIPTIARTSASFLAYAATEEIIIEFLTDDISLDPYFRLHILIELISFIYMKDFPKKRKKLFSKNVPTSFSEILTKLLYEPLILNVENFKKFSNYLILLLDFHENAPGIIENNLNYPSIELSYLKLCPFVWIKHDNSIVSLFETILECDKVPESIINSLSQGVLTNFLNNFEDLFIFDFQLDYELFDKILQSFLIRINLFFSLLLKVNFNELNKYLILISYFLESIAPSVISDTCSLLQLFFKNINIDNNLLINTFESRKRIIEILISDLFHGIDLLPGIKYDDHYSSQTITSQVEETIKFLLEFSDMNEVFIELFSHLIYQSGSSRRCQILMKLISYSISNTTRSLNEIGPICVESSIKLLSMLNSFSSSIQSKISYFLKKLIPIYIFSEYSINSYFNELINLLIDSKPISFDQFAQYLINFATNFSNLEIPVEKLRKVPQKHIAFVTVNKLIALFAEQTPEDFTKTLINSTIKELEYLNQNFNLLDNIFIKRINTEISKSLTLFSSLNSINKIHNNEIILLMNSLLNSSNRFILYYNENPKDQSLSKVLMFLAPLSQIFSKLIDFSSSLFLEIIDQFVLPTNYNSFSILWIKKIIYPIFKGLITNYSLKIKNFINLLSHHCLKILIEIKESEIKDKIKDLKDLSKFLCEFTEFLDDNFSIIILKECLQINDPFIITSAFNAIGNKSFSLMLNLWDFLFIKKDPQSLEGISDILYKFLINSGINISMFSQIPGITLELLDKLKTRLGQALQPKKRRRIIRNLLLEIYC